MALIDYLKTEMVMLDKKSQPDGYGGIVYEWQEGAPFMAGVVKKNDTAMQLAEQTGSRTVYTIVIQNPIMLQKGDRVRRKQDGADFLVTSDSVDMQTPGVSEMAFSQVTAERVSLP